MKIVIAILTLMLVTKDCGNKNKSQATISNKKQDQTTIIYQALSRGSFEEVSVSKDSIWLCNDRNRKIIKAYKIKAEDWEECFKLLNKIEIDKLPNIKAPTSMRQYDGAAYATLTIKDETTEIQSNSFDHGYPPDEIKELVEMLLSFKKITSKQ